ncbi:hypothetical protein OFC51_33855, partial [Escherichia coli]|nr:hypothetical protein [Escherichia coli]
VLRRTSYVVRKTQYAKRKTPDARGIVTPLSKGGGGIRPTRRWVGPGWGWGAVRHEPRASAALPGGEQRLVEQALEEAVEGVGPG